MLSTTFGLKFLGTNPAPIPCILCGPGFPPDNTAEEAGSTATATIAGLCLFNPVAVPLIVPPVPTPATKISISPSVSSHISRAVVCSCIAGLAGLSNCCSITAPAFSSFSSLAFRIAPFIPSAPGVSTSVAPRALSRFWRSRLMVSGMVRISLYPFTEATHASPIPVLPLVGSIIVAPGVRVPFFSASLIIDSATRSLTLPPGLKYSILTNSRAFRFSACSMFFISRSGVFPISSVRF